MQQPCASVVFLLLLTTGCNLLPSQAAQPAETMRTEYRSTERVMATEAGAESATRMKDGRSHQSSIGQTALSVVVFPVFCTSLFVWWVMTGCPD